MVFEPTTVRDLGAGIFFFRVDVISSFNTYFGGWFWLHL